MCQKSRLNPDAGRQCHEVTCGALSWNDRCQRLRATLARPFNSNSAGLNIARRARGARAPCSALQVFRLPSSSLVALTFLTGQ